MDDFHLGGRRDRGGHPVGDHREEGDVRQQPYIWPVRELLDEPSDHDR